MNWFGQWKYTIFAVAFLALAIWALVREGDSSVAYWVQLSISITIGAAGWVRDDITSKTYVLVGVKEVQRDGS